MNVLSNVINVIKLMYYIFFSSQVLERQQYYIITSKRVTFLEKRGNKSGNFLKTDKQFVVGKKLIKSLAFS